jgi:hypothetical protein
MGIPRGDWKNCITERGWPECPLEVELRKEITNYSPREDKEGWS